MRFRGILMTNLAKSFLSSYFMRVFSRYIFHHLMFRVSSLFRAIQFVCNFYIHILLTPDWYPQKQYHLIAIGAKLPLYSKYLFVSYIENNNNNNKYENRNKFEKKKKKMAIKLGIETNGNGIDSEICWITWDMKRIFFQ